MPEDFTISAGDATLCGEDSGPPAPEFAGRPPVLLLHGLTATRRYVVMGSRSLERSGHRTIAYDARGHGESGAGEAELSYELLASDLAAVMDARGVQRAVLAGVSMGAHTLVNFALRRPERVAGVVVITPAYDGRLGSMERWLRLARGLREGGVDGFVEAYDLAAVGPELRDTVETVIRQRMARHRSLAAIARALEQVPRSRPFESLEQLAQIRVPAAVIASGDEADPEHPRAVAEAYARALPDARLVEDQPGRSPVAWQGSQVSRVIAEVVSCAS